MTNSHSHSHNGSMVHDHRDVSGGAVRAAIFGVSDGLVSNAALILGVAGAQLSSSNVLATGVAGLLAGATSMAAGEYVSVKGEAELIERELSIERKSLKENPAMEIKELKAIYIEKGLSSSEAQIVAEAIHRDPEVALEVHATEELGISPDNVGNPVAAAASSFLAFSAGALVPLVPWMITEESNAVTASLLLSILFAATIGVVLSIFTEQSMAKTVFRQVAVAVVACSITYLVGDQFV